MKKHRVMDWIFLLFIALIAGTASRSFLIHASSIVPETVENRGQAAGAAWLNGKGTPADTADNPKQVLNAFENLYTLRIGEKVRVGKLLLVYRGFDEQGRFNLDVAIPALDAHTFYPYHFRKKDFAKGIKLNIYAFKVLSVRRNVLHLQAEDNSTGG